MHGWALAENAARVLGEIKKSHVWVKTKRKSLTVPEQKAFMNYLYSNHQYQGWKPVITVLIGSGMRIGECLGLRWEDLDFENRIIDINHSLVHRKVDDSGTNFHINTPKTEAGCRRIPMIGEVYDAFLEEYQIQQITGFCTQEIDGYSGFVFASSGGTITIPSEVNHAIHNITADYNKEETAKAKREKRESVENLARTGMSFDDLRKSFPEFSIKEVEKIYMRVRKERNSDLSQTQSKINCS